MVVEAGKAMVVYGKSNGLGSRVQEHHVFFSCPDLVLVSALFQGKTWLRWPYINICFFTTGYHILAF